jgi:hypothetical protein
MELVRSLCARKAQRVFVVAPADVKRARLQARLPRIRGSLRRAAESTTCGRYVSTAGDTERFDRGPSLRTPDGVHMTRLGAQRVWARVRAQVLSALSVVSPPLCSQCCEPDVPRDLPPPRPDSERSTRFLQSGGSTGT